MSHITKEQYTAAYQVGLEFFDAQGRLGISEAKKKLSQSGLNPNSAADFIYDVGHLLRGECYKRALSENATDDYLAWIKRDRGDQSLANALKALEKHIAYRQKRKTADKCLGLVRLLQKHQAALTRSSEAALIMEWRDEESAGCVDWFPLSWFEKEGKLKAVGHAVGEHDKKQGVALCDVLVHETSVELDYRPYAKQNELNDVLSGVVRLTFADDDRTAIDRVEWKAANSDRFEPTAFKATAPVVPTTGFPYAKPTERAERTARMVRERPGQSAFRRMLRLVYQNTCCVTGCSVPEELEAAHIDPFVSEESDHIQNGLLLRRDLHALFDKHLWSVHPITKKIHFAQQALCPESYSSLNGLQMKRPSNEAHHPHADALTRHWQQFQKLRGTTLTSQRHA